MTWIRIVPVEMEEEADTAFLFWRHRNLTHDSGFRVEKVTPCSEFRLDVICNDPLMKPKRPGEPFR